MSISSQDLAGFSKLLDSALALPPDARAAWVEALGAEYGSMKTVLRELLARDDLKETGSFLATLPKFAPAIADTTAVFNPGDTVGPYRLERLIGTGGMGVVWLADRPDGVVKRRVALKLPHLTDASAGLAERMARERDILARLEHPHIARLYDAGIATDGRPYLALEYVEGEPINQYCEAHGSSLRARLMLVLQICRAVAYAHAHLVVHRDLKPSNILIDADGQGHLLDFGIAKLLTTDAPAEAAVTRLGGIALTPEYASPEQIQGLAVTTATDIYSLGVVVYELLATARPYAPGKTRDTFALAQAVLSTEPRRPSELTTSTTMRRALRGDLDTIVLKALKKLPEERYATVAEFADDLERYLRGEPIRARPDSSWYRARKYVGRHRLGVASAAAVIAALVTGLGVSLWQAREARIQARTAAAEENFLESIFRQSSNDQADPAKARATTAAELLQIGAKSVDQALKDVPEARLRVLGTLAQMENNLELFDEAAVLGRKRVALAKSLYGPTDERVVDALTDLSTV
ncbi:MAG: serine/threonine-protein kinase, partial [Steroidobacteraceae bacterium]